MANESFYEADGVTAGFSESPVSVSAEINEDGTGVVTVRFPEKIYGVQFLPDGARELGITLLASAELVEQEVKEREDGHEIS